MDAKTLISEDSTVNLVTNDVIDGIVYGKMRISNDHFSKPIFFLISELDPSNLSVAAVNYW
jgi:hypothetical protein